MTHDSVSSFFYEAAKSWGHYVVTLNIIGGVTMGLLETTKNLLPIRRYFQKWRLQTWFNEAAQRVNMERPEAYLDRRAERSEELSKDEISIASTDLWGNKISACQAEIELIALAANGKEEAFYDLQPEEIASAYNAVIQIVLEAPMQNLNLLKITASRAVVRDIWIVARRIPEPMTQEYLDSRNRVLHQCQRAIAGFDVSTNFRWKWIMRVAALCISTVVTAIALSNDATKVSANVVSIFFTSVMAGFLAPVAKDLLTVLQNAGGN
jgi:hypothetical protein